MPAGCAVRNLFAALIDATIAEKSQRRKRRLLSILIVAGGKGCAQTPGGQSVTKAWADQITGV
jgi:hypothetical protein